MADRETQQPIAAHLVAPNEEAQHAADDEKSMGLFQAIRLYPKVVGWSVVLSSALIMEGYDRALLGSLYGSSMFNQKYGLLNERTGKWAIQPNWQSALSNGARAGEVIGLLINGFVSERYGYRKTMIGALIAITCFIFVLFFAPNVQTLVVGEVFCGIPWGMFQTLTTQYASEVAPVQLRPILTTFCWVMGQFIAAGVNRACVLREDQWAYRIPFAIQWIWPLPIAIGVALAPESPWWHIVCFAWIAQTICGTNIMGYFAYFMQQAGLPTIQSFNMSMVSLALGLIGTMGSWFLMQKLGRRTIHFSGACTLFVLLIIVGSCSFAGNDASNWAIGAVLIVFVFIYDFTIGPVTYSIVAEMPSTRLKSKTINLARALYNTSNIVVNVLTNYQLGSGGWAWGAKTAYFWAGTCGCVVVWVYFRLPEPKGRTYAELDALFEGKVSARKFARTQVDPYGRGIGVEKVEGKEVANPE
ncbi:general substrate transporter [Macroventuria anomochaeta]|uniref:General substrate transporter n=1 Tax=Macroventuria anomochaeta TaxID=301207 RepID=A0ACB6RPC8_9PLEO|nr:general substrate transporter [Macroventuria anomochaeta]KAF2623593.1 general substrate transporter [Macroventuria anomochaeta]